MKNIIIPKPKDPSLTGQLRSLYLSLKGVSPNENINFNFDQLSFIGPLLLLPISSYIHTSSSTYTISNTNNIKSYLDTIYFPKGLASISAFHQQIQKTKNYIPISVLIRDQEAERERLESLFSTIVYQSINSPRITGIQNAIYYPITELVANIFDHSKSDKGFLFGQFYKKKDFLEICIVDRGRGLATAYKEEKGLKLSDDLAIIEAMKGNSTKPDKDRGYGINSSRRVVCEGLDGEFIFVSGAAALLASKGKNRLVNLPNFYWQGVIVAYRIPKPKNEFNISEYVE